MTEQRRRRRKAAPTRAFRFLGVGGGVEESGHVGFQFGEILVAQVHHVAGLVGFVMDVFLEVGGKAEVLGGVLGFGEGGGQVVEAVFHFDLELGVGDHDVGEVEHDVGRAGEKVVLASRVLPVPVILAEVGEYVVFALGIVFEFFANVLVEVGNERAADGGFLGIVVCGIADQVVRGAGEAGVEAAGGKAAAALEV